MRKFDTWKSVFIAVAAFRMLLIGAPQDAAPNEIGGVYYLDGSDFKALPKEPSPASGRVHFSGRMKGAHAAIRLASGQPHNFRVCSTDPTRYKLYKLHSTSNSREVTIVKVNVWIGGGKSVLSESEVPITFQSADATCFSISTKELLPEGEYALSPLGEEFAFGFGIGEVKRSK